MSVQHSTVRVRARELVDLVDAAPRPVLDEAASLLESLVSSPDLEAASMLERVRGTALRVLGDLPAAKRSLVAAADHGRAAGSPLLEGEALMSLGVVEAYLGDPALGMQHFDRAESLLDGLAGARVVFQRSSIHYRQGEYADALRLMNDALPVFEREGDHRHVAHTLSNRGVVLGYEGSLAQAARDLARADAIYREFGLASAASIATHNLGWVAVRNGELARGLSLFDHAARELEAQGRPHPELAIDRCEALLAAGLPGEAEPIAAAAATALTESGNVMEGAEAYLMLAHARLGRGDYDGGGDAAASAEALFRSLDRMTWAASAHALELQAKWGRGGLSASDEMDLVRTAEVLEERKQHSAARDAFLLAGRVALARGDDDSAEALLDRVVGSRSRGPVNVRVLSWLALTLVRQARGNSYGAARAAAAGARALADSQAAVGAIDTRATMSRHAEELFAIGLSLALQAGDAARVFDWMERSRAGSLRFPPVVPPDDAGLSADLRELRLVASEVREREAAGLDTARLRVRQGELESSVSERSRRVAGPGSDAGVELSSIDAVQVALGGRTLVALNLVEGRRVAVVIDGVGARLVEAGEAGDCDDQIGALTRRLRRLALRAAGGRKDTLERSIADAVEQLDDRILGPLGVSAELVVVPSRDLRDVPWGALSRRRGAAIAVAPSASLWLHAERRRPRKASTRPAVVVSGPAVDAGNVEFDAVASLYPDAVRLSGVEATSEAVMEALEGADVAHLIAHGSTTAENPLFSHLLLHDGPLFAYDLQRLKRPPRVIVLSSCSLGGSKQVTAGESLGMASILLAAGTSSVICTSSLLPDTDPTATAAAEFHRALRSGESTARSLFGVAVDSPLLALECVGAS